MRRHKPCWWQLCLTGRNTLCNFGRGKCVEHPYEIILNLGQVAKEEMFIEKVKQDVQQTPDKD